MPQVDHSQDAKPKDTYSEVVPTESREKGKEASCAAQWHRTMSTDLFWAFVFAMVCGLIAAYFILRQAILDALTEHSKRERERDDERKRRGVR